MAYQMTLTLTEQEYAALTAEAAKNGKRPETVLHDPIQRLHPSPPAKPTLTGREFMEQLYREGKLLNLPHPQPLSPEEQAEREHLAHLFAGGKSMADIINEDRGPY